MFLEMEKLEEFINMLEAETDKDIPVFIKNVKELEQQSGSITGLIILQYQFDTDMVVMYREVVDNIVVPTVPVINHLLITGIDEEIVEKVRTHGTKQLEELDKKLKEEEAKAMKVLGEHGFKNIIPSVWV